MKKIINLSLILFIIQLSYSQEVKLKTYVSKNGKCKSNYEYVGPVAANEHWGTCVSAGSSKLHTYKTRIKSCKRNYQYVGVNRPDIHGGHCITIKDKNYKLVSSVATTSKICGNQSVYVGPNKVSEHWGSCLTLVQLKKPDDEKNIDKQGDEKKIHNKIYGKKKKRKPSRRTNKCKNDDSTLFCLKKMREEYRTYKGNKVKFAIYTSSCKSTTGCYVIVNTSVNNKITTRKKVKVTSQNNLAIPLGIINGEEQSLSKAN